MKSRKKNKRKPPLHPTEMTDDDPGARASSLFELIPSKTTNWSSLPNRGVFAVYDRQPRLGGVLLFVVRGLPELRERLEQFQNDGRLRDSSRVFVETASLENDLTDFCLQDLVRYALVVIGKIKDYGDKGKAKAALRPSGQPSNQRDGNQGRRPLSKTMQCS